MRPARIDEIHADRSDSQCPHIQQHVAPVWQGGGTAANVLEKSTPGCGVGTVPIARINTVNIVTCTHSKGRIRHSPSSNTLVREIWMGNDRVAGMMRCREEMRDRKPYLPRILQSDAMTLSGIGL